MSDHEDGLLAIEVDADDYAETAAGDPPSVSRTYQSEGDFKAIKATYTAKIDGGKTYEDLIAAVPVLASDLTMAKDNDISTNGHSSVKLSKKDVQLLGYAVGEMYFDKEFMRAIELCERVKLSCEVDGKTTESLNRWESRCQERLSGASSFN